MPYEPPRAPDPRAGRLPRAARRGRTGMPALLLAAVLLGATTGPAVAAPAAPSELRTAPARLAAAAAAGADAGAGVDTGADARTGGDWTLEPSAGGGPGPGPNSGSGPGSGPEGEGRPYILAEGPPGSVLEDRLTLTNPGADPLRITLRGAGAGAGAGVGAEASGEGAATGGWIRAARAELTVPPRTRAEIPFTVTVPGAASPGDHAASVVAKGGGRSEAVVVRLRVSGPALPALTVERLRADPDRDRFTYELVNRGNTVLRPSVALRTEGLFGGGRDVPVRDPGVELRPGQRTTLTVPWTGAPALDRVQVRLRVTAAGGAEADAATSVWRVPWATVTALLLVAAAACGWWVRRRRTRKGGRRSDEQHLDAPDEPDEPDEPGGEDDSASHDGSAPHVERAPREDSASPGERTPHDERAPRTGRKHQQPDDGHELTGAVR